MEALKVEMVLDHEKRIQNLEHQFSNLNNRMTTFENNQLRFETTLLNEFQTTRKLFKDVISHDQSIESARLEMDKEIHKVRLEMEQKQRDSDIEAASKARELKKEVLLKVVGFGAPIIGIVTYLVQHFFK